MKQKKLSIVFMAFAGVLAAGIVYAAVNGSLLFSGTANLGTNTILQIVNARAVNSNSNYGGAASSWDGTLGTQWDETYGIINVSPDGKTATITANLSEPGDSQEFVFDVQNAGSTDAWVTDVVVDVPPPSLNYISVDGSYQSLYMWRIGVGDTTGPYNVRVEWPTSAPYDSYGKQVTYSITLNYEKYPY